MGRGDMPGLHLAALFHTTLLHATFFGATLLRAAFLGSAFFRATLFGSAFLGSALLVHLAHFAHLVALSDLDRGFAMRSRLGQGSSGEAEQERGGAEACKELFHEN